MKTPVELASSATESVPTSFDPAAIEERLRKLEKSAKEAAEAKKKYPTLQMSGVFQADAVLFDQDALSRQAHGSIQKRR